MPRGSNTDTPVVRTRRAGRLLRRRTPESRTRLDVVLSTVTPTRTPSPAVAAPRPASRARSGRSAPRPYPPRRSPRARPRAWAPREGCPTTSAATRSGPVVASVRVDRPRGRAPGTHRRTVFRLRPEAPPADRAPRGYPPERAPASRPAG